MTLWYSVLQVVLYPLLGLIMRGICYGSFLLQNGGNVMVDVLEKICLNMDCNVEDIMEIYPDPVDSTKKRTARSV